MRDKLLALGVSSVCGEISEADIRRSSSRTSISFCAWRFRNSPFAIACIRGGMARSTLADAVLRHFVERGEEPVNQLNLFPQISGP
jgi:hypothetical protein